MRKMKKVMAATLAATMIVSMNMTAFAADAGVAASDATTIDIVTKNYDVYGNEGTVFPTETLSFVVEPDSANPDSETQVTVADLTVQGVENKLTINIPSYDEVGTYHYTIKENSGNAQAVGYTTNAVQLSVQVIYNSDHTKLLANTGITNTGTTESQVKVDKLTNTYILGSLDVKKLVSGNLAAKDKYFKVNVEFTATKSVESDIAISGGSFAGDAAKNIPANPTKIDETEWVNNKVSVAVWLKHDETIHFANIPDGVSYTVVEDGAHLTGDLNGEEGYEAAYVGTDNGNTGTGKIEHIKETVDNAISITTDSDTVTITNTKESTVDTGINLDNAPYILLLAIAVLGMFGFVSKKRSSEF